MSTPKERVRAGATLLDEKASNWATTIDLDMLDMGRYPTCVLGQLRIAGVEYYTFDGVVRGAYWTNCDILGLAESGTTIALGFYEEDANENVSDEEKQEILEEEQEILRRRYIELLELWKAEIKDRLGA